jgi:hypothetical protein
VLGVDSTSVGDVVLRWIPSVDCTEHDEGTLTGLWVDAESLSNLRYPLRSEGTFGIYFKVSGAHQ